MKTILLTIALLLSTNTYAACNKPLTEKWFVASNVAFLADYSTTLSIGRSNGEYVEAAPLTKRAIGENPTTGRVQQYFAGRMLLNAAIQCWAPTNISKFLNITQTVVHSGAAANNYSIGLAFSW